MAKTRFADRPRKPVLWIGSSLGDIRELPEPVQASFGLALDDAQLGDKSPAAKPMKGFGGAGVVEVVQSLDGSTFRAVYTVKFALAVYVLHIFQKKSRSGRKTPKPEVDLIRQRLKVAEVHHARLVEAQAKEAGSEPG